MKILALLKPTNYRAILLIAAAVSAGALATAFTAQYGFLLHPCELCLMQRYPYAAIILLGIVGAFLVKNPKLQKNFVLLCAALFVVDALIAGYHVGVEMDIFKGPDACSSSNTGEQTLEQMRAAIMNAPLVSCKQAMAYMFGLSMAAWNMMFACAAALWTLWRWRKTT